MAELNSAQSNCVPKETFYQELDAFKAKQIKSESLITLFIDDAFFDKAEAYLKHKKEEELGVRTTEETGLNMTKWELSTIKRKNWIYSNGSVLTVDKKKVVPKRQLHEVLSRAHMRIAHRGRQITGKWINENYSEVNLKVVGLFVGLCRFHAEQQAVTSRMKIVEKPLRSSEFLALVEIDLMDFRNCSCDCSEPHRWAMNIIDHHTKFTHVSPLHSKNADEVVTVLKTFCYTYGFPQKILTDNGKEFKNQKMEKFCQENGIEQAHGSPRTPTTQGLVERSNRSWKEDMRAIIVSQTRGTARWCEYTMEAAYTRNISYHRAIKQSPYEAVFGIKPHREKLPTSNNEEIPDLEAETPTEVDAGQDAIDDQRSKKRKSIRENQDAYNCKMMKQTLKNSQGKSFKVDDMVSIKIDKVDKTTAMHPNMLIGKITAIEDKYAKVVTQFGIVKGFVAFSRLNPCTATAVKLNYDKHISFTAACKEASNFS